MFTELDRFTEAPGGPHFILITKDMRKLSWTAVSTYGSDFWNTCLIPCYSYRFMLHCNDHNPCACPHMLCCLHDQPHPLCSVCSVCWKPAATDKALWSSVLGPCLTPAFCQLQHGSVARTVLMLLIALSQYKKQIRDHGLSTQNQWVNVQFR